MTAARPYAILIAAMGGEGGGVLAGWITDAAVAAGLFAQRTSVPGVAQRTGATTYYIEIHPEPLDGLKGRRPVLALQPTPGEVDLVVASEMIEAGRTMLNGFVDRDRTLLVASTHRVYTIEEKGVGGDGRFEVERVAAAAPRLARRAVLFDAAAAAREAGCHVNAVLLGAVAATQALPFAADLLRAAVAGGKAAEANLRGFAAGSAAAAAGPAPRREREAATLDDILAAAEARLIDYQDADYAALFRRRLEAVRAAAPGDPRLAAAVARQLALWMSYEDVFRVAQLKTRPERLARLRAGAGGGAVQVREYLAPGLDELCTLLPPGPAAALSRWAGRRGSRRRLALPLRVASTSVFGHALLRLLAAGRKRRRRGARDAEEQRRIEDWLARVTAAAAVDGELAAQTAECARLVAGYGDTRERGLAAFERIMTEIVDPALAGALAAPLAVDALIQARLAAQKDPEGDGLAEVLAAMPRPTRRAAE